MVLCDGGHGVARGGALAGVRDEQVQRSTDGDGDEAVDDECLGCGGHELQKGKAVEERSRIVLSEVFRTTSSTSTATR